MNLKGLSDNREQAGRDLKNEEALYNKLKQDINQKRLKKGTPKKNILSEYGQPVFYRAVNHKNEIKLCLIWRHPTEFFSSDMLYLYFDGEEKLVFWEIKPAPLAEEQPPAQETAG